MPYQISLPTICTIFTGLATLAAAIRPLGSSFGIPGRNATYDYIVVGGGNAGLTIASRLAEQHKGRVAVIEAGTFYEIGNGNQSQIPLLDDMYISKALEDWQPLIDWGYVTSPQTVRIDIQSGLDSIALYLTRAEERIRRQIPLCTRKMSWGLFGQKLYDISARHQRIVSSVGRFGGRRQLHI